MKYGKKLDSKKCSKCNQVKDISEFYEKKGNFIIDANGITRWIGPRYGAVCKNCTQEKNRLRTGYYIRNGFKYVFESPINNLKKCTQCRIYQPLEDFHKNNNTCKKCLAHIKKKTYNSHQKKPRTQLSSKELKRMRKARSFLERYLKGDGCCLYCWEINPWMLNHHHVWGRKHNDFTITLCENHHAALSRYMPFLLEKWYSSSDNEK